MTPKIWAIDPALPSDPLMKKSVAFGELPLSGNLRISCTGFTYDKGLNPRLRTPSLVLSTM